MVKKLVLHISDDDGLQDDCKVEDILQINQSLLEIATVYKNKITEHYQNKSWDRYKRLSNEYELIFYSSNSTTNIASVNPVSRSFFKLWEILHDFEKEIGLSTNTPMNCVFLAEGPGGFYEAFYRKRKHVHDICHGMTLKSANKTVPDWKMNRKLPLKISYGKDGTGNLYNVENLVNFTDVVGKGNVDFITADGGFDFSSDFNHQEDQSARLIISEVLAALLMQKDNGTFVLKVYDCFNEETLKILHILNAHYRNMYLIKPLTSRPANSERYILCTGFFKGDQVKYIHTVKLLKYIVANYDTIDLQRAFEDITYDSSFLAHIVMYNLYYTMRQVYYIQRTINYITFFSTYQNSSEVEQAIIDKHKVKSIKWCIKYKIPYKE